MNNTSKQYIIVFYTVEVKPPELYWNNNDDMPKLFARIVELTKHKAKFCVYEVGNCAGDFS